jgi:hypothetical protein
MPDCSHLAGQLLGFVTSAALPICANKGPSAPSYSRTERTLRISPPIDLFRLSPVPVGPKICPYAREFRASLRRIADMPDSLADEAVRGELVSAVCQPVDTLAAVDKAVVDSWL